MHAASRSGAAEELIVSTAAVWERIHALGPDRVYPDRVDPEAVTDEELTGASLVQLVDARGESWRPTVLTRIRVLDIPHERYEVHSIDMLEEAAAKLVTDEAAEQRRADRFAEKQERARRKAKGLVDAEEREEVLDAAARGFAWEDLTEDWDEPPPKPEHLNRSDGQSVLYAGMRNFIVGFTESGKSWLIALCILQEILAGRPVVYLDHENGPAITKDRLRSLGLSRDQVKRCVRYVRLSGPLPPGLARELAEKTWAEGARVMFADALTPIANALGLEVHGGNVNAVEEIYTLVLDPWAEVGFCATLIDNTPRSDKTRSAGSQHKDAGVGGAVVSVVADVKFSKTVRGSSKIYLNKDRGGEADVVVEDDRRLWGELHIGPDPVGGVGDDWTRTSAVITPPSPPPDPLAALAEAADRIVATLTLAAAAIRKQGLTEVKSMRTLTDWMSVVQPLDPAYEYAHTNRTYITDVLFKTSSEPDRTAAGLRCTVRASRTKSGAMRHDYLVELL